MGILGLKPGACFVMIDAVGDEGGKQLWMDVARKFVGLQGSNSAAPN